MDTSEESPRLGQFWAAVIGGRHETREGDPAGSVVVACHGGTISFRGAQANSGWSVDVRERGPEEVDVEFESNGDADDVRIEASCVGGQPRFSD